MGVLLILVAIGVIWYLLSNKKRQDNMSANTPLGGEADAVVDEAVAVVNDFLNAGKIATLFTDHQTTDYHGLIIIVADSRPPYSGKKANCGFMIKMNDVSDLTIGASRSPKMLTKNPDVAEAYYNFVDKYSDCFDSSEHGYVYKTRRAVLITSGQKNQMEAMLRQQIMEKCPLAEFSGGLLYTKNVAR